ncbi:Vacuolar protein sorting-associated protein 17, variant 3 [Basidiobolus ranarum]|uniref:Vacuolar protein sorting-associated protein 17, variant 3 n=1 Tax=Basidiobolus ranarum TaxID=34480 RepID=A0ABR2WUX0_9FUNG
MPEPIVGKVTEIGLPKPSVTFYKQEDTPLVLTLTSIDKAKRELVYRIKAKTNLSQYRKKNYDAVERTYGEFERLHTYLLNAYPECIIPMLPRQPDECGSPDKNLRLIKNALQNFLGRLAAHPILCQDSELQSFIETDFVYKPTSRVNPIKVNRFRTKVKDTSNGEKDPLDSEYTALVALENNLQNSSKILTKLSRTRKSNGILFVQKFHRKVILNIGCYQRFFYIDWSNSEVEIASKLTSFAASEVTSPMSRPLRRLGEYFSKSSELNVVQACYHQRQICNFEYEFLKQILLYIDGSPKCSFGVLF